VCANVPLRINTVGKTSRKLQERRLIDTNL